MKVLLADDHAMVREGLRALLERDPDVRVVGEAGDGLEAVSRALALEPDVVVMDVVMPRLNGVEATRRVLEARPSTGVLGLSMHADPGYVRAMLEAGAAGYVPKTAPSEELRRALRAVREGRTCVSPDVADSVVGLLRRGGAARPAQPAELSARERETLGLLADGNTSKEVAARLNIAVSTVETHRRQIMAKLGLRSVAQLTKYAIRHGLTSVE